MHLFHKVGWEAAGVSILSAVSEHIPKNPNYAISYGGLGSPGQVLVKISSTASRSNRRFSNCDPIALTEPTLRQRRPGPMSAVM
jgi:hypothetical protein